MKGKNFLVIFAISVLLVSITGSNFGLPAFAEDSADDSPNDVKREEITDKKDEMKEKIKEEIHKQKELREEYKAKLEEKRKELAGYHQDLREKYIDLKNEYKEKYLQLRISNIDSDSSVTEDEKYQFEIKREELKLLKHDFREEIKALKLEAREHFKLFKQEMKSDLQERKHKMHDRIADLKIKYKQEIKEIKNLRSSAIENDYPETDDRKITMCHIPPGNPDNAQTLSVSKNAWRAHMAHGDYLDKCKDLGDDDETDEKDYELKVRAEILGEQSEVRVELEFLSEFTEQGAIIEDIIEKFALTSEQADAALKIEEEGEDELEEKFEVEIEKGTEVSEVEVELRFVIDTIEREMIVDAIVERTQLTIEQIEGILVEYYDDDEEDETEGEKIEVTLEEQLGLDQNEN